MSSFTLQLKDLKDKLKILNSCASKNKLYPMTELLGFKSKFGNLALFTTDNLIQARAVLNIEEHLEDIDFCIMLDQFYKLINKIKGTEITCMVNNTKLKVVSDSGNYLFEFITDDSGPVSFYEADFLKTEGSFTWDSEKEEDVPKFVSQIVKIGNNIITNAPGYEVVDGYYFSGDQKVICTNSNIIGLHGFDKSWNLKDSFTEIVSSKFMSLCHSANVEAFMYLVYEELYCAANDDITLISLPSPYSKFYPREALENSINNLSGKYIGHFYVDELLDTLSRLDLFTNPLSKNCAYVSLTPNSFVISSGDGRFFEEVPLNDIGEDFVVPDIKFAVDIKLLISALKCFNNQCSLALDDQSLVLKSKNTTLIVATEQINSVEKAMIKWQENQD